MFQPFYTTIQTSKILNFIKAIETMLPLYAKLFFLCIRLCMKSFTCLSKTDSKPQLDKSHLTPKHILKHLETKSTTSH